MSDLLKNAIKLPNINWNFVMLGGHVQSVKKGWRYPLERHLIYEMIYVVDGQERIQWDDYQTTISTGEFVIISPGMYHVVSAVQHLTYFCFHFDINEPSIEEKLIGNQHLIFKSNNPKTAKIIPYLHKMIKLVSANEHYTITEKMLLLENLSHFIISVYQTLNAKDYEATGSLYSLQYAKLMKTNIKSILDKEIIKNVNNYNSASSPQSVNIIAATCRRLNLSTGYGSRIYRKCFGSSPQKYLAQLKIQNAKRLLMKPQLTINQVAFALGYKASSNFSRQFKKMTDMTPKGYRLAKANQSMEKELFKDNFQDLYEVAKNHPGDAWEIY